MDNFTSQLSLDYSGIFSYKFTDYFLKIVIGMNKLFARIKFSFHMSAYNIKLLVIFIGSTTSVLAITNLQTNEKFGPYVFRLEVKDKSGNKDSTNVSILVNKAVNQKPRKLQISPNFTVNNSIWGEKCE